MFRALRLRNQLAKITTSILIEPRVYSVTQRLISIDDSGDTPLHKIMRRCVDPVELKCFIDDIGEEQAARMASTVNHSGRIPIEVLMKENKILEQPQQQKQTYEGRWAAVLKDYTHYLLPLMKKNHMKKLKEPISTDVVLRQYYSKNNLKLNANLILACEIANEARAPIEKSYTHAQTNELPARESAELRKKTERMRKEIFRLIDYRVTGFMTKYPDEVVKYQLGNCYELSILVMNAFRKRYGFQSAGLYRARNSDHDIVIIDVDPRSHDKSTELQCINENSVIIDALSGSVFPVYKKDSALYCYKHISLNLQTPQNNETIITNVYPKNNPKFHLWQGLYFVSNKDKEISDLKKFYSYFNIDAELQKQIEYYPLDNLFVFPRMCEDNVFESISNILTKNGIHYSLALNGSGRVLGDGMELRLSNPLPEIISIFEKHELEAPRDSSIQFRKN